MRIYNEICRALTDDQPVTLATIIATAGSTPAPSESKMLLFRGEKSHAIGTIGGGCLDASVIVSVRDDPHTAAVKILDYTLDDDIGDTGLNCGGTVTIALEPLSRQFLPLYRMIVSMQDEGEDACLVTTITPGAASRKTLYNTRGKTVAGSELPAAADELLRRHILDARFPHEPIRVQAGSDAYLLEFVQSQPHLFVFGGGHVGRAVSQCASLAGFRVTVVDDRHAYANKERFPEAFSVLCESFTESFKRLRITPSSYVVIVTRGHRHDEEVLEQALPLSPKYIGMIGSKRKVSGTFDRLAAKGASPALLEKIHAPVGLSIGAVTADEIGVSIVAELIAVRRNALDSLESAVSMRLNYSGSKH